MPGGKKGAITVGLLVALGAASHFVPILFSKPEQEKPKSLSDVERLRKQ